MGLSLLPLQEDHPNPPPLPPSYTKVAASVLTFKYVYHWECQPRVSLGMSAESNTAPLRGNLAVQIDPNLFIHEFGIWVCLKGFMTWRNKIMKTCCYIILTTCCHGNSPKWPPNTII